MSRRGSPEKEKQKEEMKRIGYNIKMRRLSLGKEQLDISEAVGIPQPTYSRIENGEYLRIPIHLIDKLATYFKVTREELMGIKDELDHLPAHIKEFVKNPANKEVLEKAYIIWKYEQLQTEK